MSKNLKSSEEGLLNEWGAALDNAEDQQEIAVRMEENGYDAAKIAEGKNQLASTWPIFKKNQKEDDEKSAAGAAYKEKKKALDTTFRKHRNKALIVYIDDPLASARLAITPPYPDTYWNWFKSARKFYDEVTTNLDDQAALAQLKITPEQLLAGQQLVSEVEVARKKYRKEKGDSEAATKEKDIALATMEKWMSKFYKVARIALEDKPQLLEALGKTKKR